MTNFEFKGWVMFPLFILTAILAVITYPIRVLIIFISLLIQNRLG